MPCKPPVVHRRAYLATTAAGLSAALVGCLGGGLDEEEVEVIDSWLLDAVELVDEGVLLVSFWFEEPDSVDLDEIAPLETEAGELLNRWDEEIRPKMDDLRETDIDRTVADETWTVDGENLEAALEELRWSVDAVHTGVGALLEEDGDPDELDQEDESTLEELVDRGRESVGEAVDLWFRRQDDG